MEECTAKLESLKKQETLLKQQLQEEQPEKEVDQKEIVKDVKTAVDFDDKRRVVLKYISKITLIRKGEKRKQNYDLEFHIEFWFLPIYFFCACRKNVKGETENKILKK